MHRMIAVYMPHAGYPHEDLCSVYEQLHCVLTETLSLGHATVVGGDFNSQLRVGRRGDMLQKLSSMFSLQVANEACGPDAWTFHSSAGETRQIDFILFSKNMLRAGFSGPTDRIDLGSHHRAVWCKLATQRRVKKPSGTTKTPVTRAARVLKQLSSGQ